VIDVHGLGNSEGNLVTQARAEVSSSSRFTLRRRRRGDTHAAVWWAGDPARLAPPGRDSRRTNAWAELKMHADPADRFIVATALRYGVPLISKDRSMRVLRFLETIW
jgi:PIN domain nuclease of toxin-antitoxin system